MSDTTMFRRGLTFAFIGGVAACGGGNSTGPSTPTGPGGGRPAVVISYRAPTQPRTNLPASAQACVTGVGETHAHLSWRTPDYVALRATAAERWEVSVSDAPVGARPEPGLAFSVDASGRVTP